MNRRVLIGSVLIAGALGLSGCGGGKPLAKGRDANTKSVLCSFFPVYLFTKNVVGDRSNISVGLMLPAEMGCPHDYDLRPEDVKKIQQADLFILNGAGLEQFTPAQIKNANPKAVIVDSSVNVVGLKQDDHDHLAHDHDHETPKDKKVSKELAKKDPHDDHDHDKHDHDKHDSHAHDDDDGDHHHHASDVNPHFFSSPRHAQAQVQAIADALSKADPEGAAIYQANSARFRQRLDELANEFKRELATVKNRRIATVHEVFDYLAKDCGLEIVATIQGSAGHDPSAGQMRKVIETIKEKKAAAVFTEPQYSDRVGKTIANDAGVPVRSLDPVASGPADAPIDHYEKKMRENLATLKEVLGEPKS